jgi:hypothetical protein
MIYAQAKIETMQDQLLIFYIIVVLIALFAAIASLNLLLGQILKEIVRLWHRYRARRPTR